MMNQSRFSVLNQEASNHLSKSELKTQEAEINKRYHQEALNNFPFGKDSVKIAKYVTNQLNSHETDQNARILEEFRKRAVESRFNRNSKNKEKYITENMLPGVSRDPTLAEKVVSNAIEQWRHDQRPQLKSLNHSQHYYHPPPPQFFQPQNGHYDPRIMHMPEKLNNSMVHNLHPISVSSPNNLEQCKTIANPESLNDVPESKMKISRASQTSLKRKQHNLKLDASRMKKQYYQMKMKNERKQERHLNTLEKILRDMNREIESNSKALQKIAFEHEYYSSSMPNSKGSRRLQTDIEDSRRSALKNIRKWKLNSDLMADQTTEQQYYFKNRKQPKIQYSGNRPSYSTIDIPNYKDLYSSQTIDTKRGDKQYDSMENGSVAMERKRQMRRFFGNRSKKGMKAFQGAIHAKSNIQAEEQNSQLGKVREHLRLLKKHSNRLQTLNSVDAN